MRSSLFRGRLARFWRACLLPQLVSVPLLAQGNAGRILGTITDQSGGALAGALVTVTDVERDTARSLVADSAGAFNAPNLLPGTYRVRGEFKGFRVVERQNMPLEVGQEI